MRKNPLSLLALAVWSALPLSSPASETRVGSTGGLSLVITDETVVPHPFSLGNPAGLALLPRQNRLDLTGAFLDQDVPLLGRHSQFYGTHWNGTDPVQFHGLILFPADRFALQLDGGYMRVNDRTSVVLLTDGIDHTRELLRMAYDFGPFVLGAELKPVQASYDFALQTTSFSSVGAFGTGKTIQWDVTGGLLARFPPDPGEKEARLTLGGIYSMQPIAAETKLDLSLIEAGPSTLTATFIQTTTNFQYFGPEVYYEVPGSFQGMLIGRIQMRESVQEVASAAASLVVPEFPFEEGTGVGAIAGFKAESGLSKGQALKMGAMGVFETGELTRLTPSGALDYRNRTDKLKFMTGAGVEKKDDFLMGLQLELEIAGGSLEDPVTITQGAVDYMGYKIILGGEKWITKQWAFRTGLSFENSLNKGNDPYRLTFHSILPGTRTVATNITLGLGLKEELLQADLQFWYGQPTLYDNPSPQAFATQLGLQFSAGIFFK